MASRIMRGFAAVMLSAVCAAVFAQAGQPGRETAGKAVVVVGHASVENAGRHVALASGASVAEGDTIETGADGYVYVTTVDHGFISVRPNSSLTIEHYEYDASAPERTVIKLELHRGVVREISGKGAQAARDHYRMNTPVAALGVRGTDFTVFTDANVTSAAVRSGGIVMTPLGGGCASSGTGPCEGSTAGQLFADMKNTALQFTRGNVRPVLMDTRLTPLTAEQAGTQKAEDSAARAAATAAAAAAVTHVDPGVTPSELTFPLTAPAAPPPTTPPPPTPPVTPPATPTPPPPPEAQQIFWGRFNALASLPADTSITELLQKGSDQSGIESAFEIVRTPQTDMVMPVQGVFNFGLQSYEAYLVNTATNTAMAATISNGTLAIDFGAHTFTTSLQLNANGSSYAVSGFGGVSNDGKLMNDYLSAMKVAGGLAGKNATQAGYAFTQQLGSNQSVAGATLWGR